MQWVQLRIRGVGKVGVAPLVVGNPGIVDARGYFGNDDSLGALKPERIAAEMLNLHNAAKEIQRKLDALHPPHAVGPASVIVQCEKGQSRSVRCVGAYMIRTLRFSADNAYAHLAISFNSPRVDQCNPAAKISKGNVPTWLAEYAKQLPNLPP